MIGHCRDCQGWHYIRTGSDDQDTEVCPGVEVSGANPSHGCPERCCDRAGHLLTCHCPFGPGVDEPVAHTQGMGPVGEPVAWRCYDKDDMVYLITESRKVMEAWATMPENAVVEPLYAIPPAAGEPVAWDCETCIWTLHASALGTVWPDNGPPAKHYSHGNEMWGDCDGVARPLYAHPPTAAGCQRCEAVTDALNPMRPGDDAAFWGQDLARPDVVVAYIESIRKQRDSALAEVARLGAEKEYAEDELKSWLASDTTHANCRNVEAQLQAHVDVERRENIRARMRLEQKGIEFDALGKRLAAVEGAARMLGEVVHQHVLRLHCPDPDMSGEHKCKCYRCREALAAMNALRAALAAEDHAERRVVRWDCAECEWTLKGDYARDDVQDHHDTAIPVGCRVTVRALVEEEG